MKMSAMVSKFFHLFVFLAMITPVPGEAVPRVRNSHHSRHPAAMDLSGQTEGRWMRDSKGLTALFHHPDSAFPDGELSRTGITKQVVRRRKVKGHWVKRARTVHVARAKAFRDNRVLVHFPANLNWQEPIQLLVFFHGWNSAVAGDEPISEGLHLRETVACADRNTILVLPQGPLRAPSSSFGKLRTVAGLARFIQGLEAVLPPQPTGAPAAKDWISRIDRIVLAGHSGGGSSIAHLLNEGGQRGLDAGKGTDAERWVWDRLRTVVLLDATYGGLASFERWWLARSGRVLNSYFLEGTGTAPTSHSLAALALAHPGHEGSMDIEGIRVADLPGPIASAPHFRIPWYRLWRGLDASDGVCRWSQPRLAPNSQQTTTPSPTALP